MINEGNEEKHGFLDAARSIGSLMIPEVDAEVLSHKGISAQLLQVHGAVVPTGPAFLLKWHLSVSPDL